jgi:hypothetical protein
MMGRRKFPCAQRAGAAMGWLMRNAVGAFLFLVSSVAFAGGSHGGGGGAGGGGGGGHAAAAGGSGAHASAAGVGAGHSSATPGTSLRAGSEARRLAQSATRPKPLRPRPTPKPPPMMPLATYPWQTTAAAYPAGWYAIACTDEERRRHRCDDQLSALPR